MLKNLTTSTLLILAPLLIGCAAGSATAGYSVKAGTADDLKSETRSAIVNEAFEKCKIYVDAKMP